MPGIDIRRAHTLGKDAARKAADALSTELTNKLQVQSHWEGDVLKFERTGAKGQVAVSDSLVHVSVELGLMLRPLKGAIEAQVNKYLDRYLR
ncbi:MAG: polyhydroxyalkanoic acid system family protein [Myxococcales bacterium]|nr:polyhydroxyalkanoic acid system family protein [Myxococcales bacterium]MCB9708599.1 polyhydroxyalkanoic acid system family protein [Myxococcales bacterium]